VDAQRDYCKQFLRVYRARLDQNLSDEMAWASAASAATRECPLGDAEREEAEAWLRERVKTVWRQTE
jgi:hypothetical protein